MRSGARRWGLLPLLLLAGCAGEAAPCRLQQAADLPATVVAGHVRVPGAVNGIATPLTLDTGASRSAIDAGAMDRLHVRRIEQAETRRARRGGVVDTDDFASRRTAGVAGEAETFDAAAELQLGSESARRRVAVFPLPGASALVGTDVLRDYSVEFDLPARRVRLWHAPGCGAADLPWTGPRVEVPLQVSERGVPRLVVAIDGKPFVAVLDSGAALTVVRPETAARLGVGKAALAEDPSTGMRGIAGGPVDVRLHRFETLRVGGERISKPLLGVAGAPLAIDGDMLLGVAFFNGQRVWIDYGAGTLSFQPVTPAGASPPA